MMHLEVLSRPTALTGTYTIKPLLATTIACFHSARHRDSILQNPTGCQGVFA